MKHFGYHFCLLFLISLPSLAMDYSAKAKGLPPPARDAGVEKRRNNTTKYTKDNLPVRTNLSKENLVGLGFRHIYLVCADFKGAQLKGTQMKDVFFLDPNGQEDIIENMCRRETRSFRKSDLRNADLSGSLLIGAFNGYDQRGKRIYVSQDWFKSEGAHISVKNGGNSSIPKILKEWDADYKRNY